MASRQRWRVGCPSATARLCASIWYPSSVTLPAEFWRFHPRTWAQDLYLNKECARIGGNPLAEARLSGCGQTLWTAPSRLPALADARAHHCELVSRPESQYSATRRLDEGGHRVQGQRTHRNEDAAWPWMGGGSRSDWADSRRVAV